MDLTKTAPRSPKDKLLGLVSLKRTIDKAKAYNEGTLGEYDYDCPHDKPLFKFLGTNGRQFAEKVAELGSDAKIAAWIEATHLKNKTPEQIATFNDERMKWHPSPGDPSYDYFMQLHHHVAPGRPEVKTWFDLLDLDEHRPVLHATAI